MEGVARLRLSNDIEFEEQNFIALMNEAREVSPSKSMYHLTFIVSSHSVLMLENLMDS